ncbi:MAG: hypothetical protein JNK85_29590 [Verrucomicrobiales bacterium]|nr:hypothetical protein [Verrucomicrobiales bacterium]
MHRKEFADGSSVLFLTAAETRELTRGQACREGVATGGAVGELASLLPPGRWVILDARQICSCPMIITGRGGPMSPEDREVEIFTASASGTLAARAIDNIVDQLQGAANE